jgi:hypothetical protein
MMTDVARGLRADLISFRVAIDRARLIFALALDFPSHTSNLYCAVLVHSALKGVVFQDFPVGEDQTTPVRQTQDPTSSTRQPAHVLHCAPAAARARCTAPFACTHRANGETTARGTCAWQRARGLMFPYEHLRILACASARNRGMNTRGTLRTGLQWCRRPAGTVQAWDNRYGSRPHFV